jgi:serine/threonine protein kinase
MAVLTRSHIHTISHTPRYYRAPELIFESTDYTTAVDIWSLGCVFAEMLLGAPLFPGDSGVDQLIEIIKILGTPSKRQIQAMNPNHVSFKFAQIEPHAWSRVFRNRAPPEALALVDSLLQYDPADRISAMEALASPFFDSLRRGDARLPNGKPLPPLFDFTQEEMKEMKVLGITARVVPDAHPLSTAKSTHSHSHRGEQEQALGVHMDVSP